MEYVISFDKIGMADLAKVGGKNASLGEMIHHLKEAGVRVPPGFATTSAAYYDFLKQNKLDAKIQQLLKKTNPKKLKQLNQVSKQIQKLILAGKFAEKFIAAITKAFSELQAHAVAVRSSATAEDLPEASFAGQAETLLNIRGTKQVLQAIKEVYASLFTARMIAYRQHHGFKDEQIAISVGIQKMIRSDKASSGVMFTLDTESGFDQVVFINAAYGLGETIVQGQVNPDEFYVHKPSLRANKFAILQRTLGDKKIKMIYATGKKDKQVKVVKVDPKLQQKFCLSDADIEELGRQALTIEEHYQRPMDIEWGKDGLDGKIYILQARPETVKSQNKSQTLQRYQLLEKGKIKIIGRSIGTWIGQGKARIIANHSQMNTMSKGEVLVTDMTDPDWEPIMKLASAIVTNHGGRTCHAAIVARELGIPAVVGCGNATAVIKTGEPITVSCAEGETGFVYEKLLKFNIEKMNVKEMPALPFRLCMNLGNPDRAFNYQFLPNDGVGLARLEFIISDKIGVHPQACLQFKKLSKKIQRQIALHTAAYSSPVEFYTEKLREGIAIIAAAFYPKEVIFRFSDFKSNEYANLLGGRIFEPVEENPMIGFRGASRYASKEFRDCFLLECEAFKRVRHQMGLENAQVMIPFVRTPEELKEVIKIIEKSGLKTKSSNLKIYMMCEIPTNALQPERFLPFVDGFSIGSNDLTQMTLGLDRDSELVAHAFDERDPAVKDLFRGAINACNKAGKYIGICGQGPSDHPDLAKWLIDQGIQSLSLSPDTIVSTWLYLAGKKTS